MPPSTPLFLSCEATFFNGLLMVDIGRLGEYVGGTVTVRGWVEATRGHGKVSFLVVRDGTGTLQTVLVKSQIEETIWDVHGSLSQESLVTVTGEVKEDARAPGGYELGVTTLSLLSGADEYPIQAKEHGVDFLLDHRHLRSEEHTSELQSQ